MGSQTQHPVHIEVGATKMNFISIHIISDLQFRRSANHFHFHRHPYSSECCLSKISDAEGSSTKGGVSYYSDQKMQIRWLFSVRDN